MWSRLRKAWQSSISMTFPALAVFQEQSVGYQSTSFMPPSEPRCSAMPALSATSVVVSQYKPGKCTQHQKSLSWQEQAPPLHDCLLKSHAPQALELAHHLEQRGAVVVNRWASSVACQDRVLMAQRMEEAHLPWPRSWSFSSLEHLLGQHEFLSTLSFPIIIKSYYSHRGDLVDKVDSLAALQALAPQWSQERVVLQEFAAGDGWDIKFWVIGEQVFAARRRTALEPNAPKTDVPLADKDLPDEWV